MKYVFLMWTCFYVNAFVGGNFCVVFKNFRFDLILQSARNPRIVHVKRIVVKLCRIIRLTLNLRRKVC